MEENFVLIIIQLYIQTSSSGVSKLLLVFWFFHGNLLRFFGILLYSHVWLQLTHRSRHLDSYQTSLLWECGFTLIKVGIIPMAWKSYIFFNYQKYKSPHICMISMHIGRASFWLIRHDVLINNETRVWNNYFGLVCVIQKYLTIILWNWLCS